MLYRGTNLELQSGDIILYHDSLGLQPVTWLAKAIQLFTRSYYNHAGVVISNWNKLFINEARGTGLISRPLENCIERKGCKIMVRRPTYKFWESDLCVRANSKLGTKYDKEALLDNLWYITFGKWIGRTKQNAESKMVCSEYVAWVHRMNGWWMKNPKDLANSDLFITIYTEQ